MHKPVQGRLGRHRLKPAASNKGMELSKPEYLVGVWPTELGVIESGFAAHAQCWTDVKGRA
jgi:hypothetical protein